MMFTSATRQGNDWCLVNAWQQQLRLPALPMHTETTVRIGTLGTRFVAKINKRTGNRAELMARLFKSLGCPLFLLDTRRSGCGAQGSWSPLEFASIIPARLDDSQCYGFLHLPVLAPASSLLATEKRGELAGWREFRQRYNAGLSDEAVAVARSFVEAAIVRGGLAVLVCAEPFSRVFDQLPTETQDGCHCHRFNLARRIANAMRVDQPKLRIERVDLDLAAFASSVHSRQGYAPDSTPL